VTLLPTQKVVGPEAEMVGVSGKALTVTVVVEEGKLWHPFEFVTLTVKLPDVFTFIL
jgi:hypothetical protein